ncbi:pineal opsin-like [Osmerus eperlanus]|uniref:pineal opsin-like n=1 Tax=Osmerus eperlanus TaxID=29151 RepID=UPI002E14AFB1
MVPSCPCPDAGHRGPTLEPRVSGINPSSRRRREQRVLFMVVVMVMCYLLCWLPYGVMALTATFGRPGLITPEASIIPSLLAKTSTFINPVIYILMNKQFYRCFRALLHCQEPQRGSSMRSSSKPPQGAPQGAPRGAPRRTNDLNFSFLVASVGQPTTAIPNVCYAPNIVAPASSDPAPAPVAKPLVVSLVAHYNG